MIESRENANLDVFVPTFPHRGRKRVGLANGDLSIEFTVYDQCRLPDLAGGGQGVVLGEPRHPWICVFEHRLELLE